MAAKAAGGRASTVAVDVRDPERVRAMVEQVVNERGRVDVLVNNAGIGGEVGASEELG